MKKLIPFIIVLVASFFVPAQLFAGHCSMSAPSNGHGPNGEELPCGELKPLSLDRTDNNPCGAPPNREVGNNTGGISGRLGIVPSGISFPPNRRGKIRCDGGTPPLANSDGSIFCPWGRHFNPSVGKCLKIGCSPFLFPSRIPPPRKLPPGLPFPPIIDPKV